MPFGLTYQDYLALMSGRGGDSDGGTGAVDEATWKAMQEPEQWRNVGGALGIRPDDPRYADLRSHVPGEPERTIYVVPGGRSNIYDQGDELVRPDDIYQGDGFTAFGEDNMTPGWQSRPDETWSYGRFAAAVAAPMVGGYLAELYPALSGAGAETAVLGAGDADAAAVAAGLDSGGSGAVGGMYSGAPSDAYWNMTADAGTTATDAGGVGLTGGDLPAGTEMPNFYDAGADPTSAFGIGEQYYTPGLGSGLNPQPWYQGILDKIADNPRLLLQAGNLVSSLGGLASDNDGGEGGGGPTELGSMGWKPPSSQAYSPAMYDPRYGSPYSGWLQQFQASQRPLGRMYG